MTPEEVGERLLALLAADNPDAGDVTAGVSGGGPGHGRAVVDVPAARWWAAVGAARDPGALGCDFFDWLSAVDELDEGLTVVAHLWSSRRRHGLLLRARLARAGDVRDVRHHLRPASGSAPVAAAARFRGQPAAQGVCAGLPGRQGLAG